VADVKQMSFVRWLAQLARDIELAAQVARLLLHPQVVESQPALNQMLERRQKSAHYPFRQRSAEQSQPRLICFVQRKIQPAGNESAHKCSCRLRVVQVVMLGQDFDDLPARRLQNTDEAA
jgi:hypothetical protein